MKKIVTAIALATVMASPVYAQAAKYAVPSAHEAPAFRNSPAADFDGSEYVGQDPDTRIQSELRRDPSDDR
jgi:heat shock protein HslJ